MPSDLFSESKEDETVIDPASTYGLQIIDFKF